MRRNGRAVRGGLRADAVFLFTLARSFVRSVWKTANHPALKSRSRIGLHRDGDGAHVELAFPRSNYFRNHDFKHSHRDGLHRRRYAEGKASWSIRPDRRGIRRSDSRSDQQLVDWLAMSIRVSRFGLQPHLVWRIGSGVTSSFRNPCRKISENNSNLRRANPVGSLKLLRSHHELWRLTTIQFLAYLAHNVFSVWALYAIYRYSWSQGMIGISLMIVGIVTAVISGGLTGGMVKRFGEKRTLYIGQFFGAERNVNRRPGQNGRVVTRFDPNHFALEYFHASRAKHDDSSRQRTRTRRIARRAPEHAFDHVHYRPMVVSSDFWMVHRSEKSNSPSWRAVLSGSRISFYRDANVDTHRARTRSNHKRPCHRTCRWRHQKSPRLALRRLAKRKENI